MSWRSVLTGQHWVDVVDGGGVFALEITTSHEAGFGSRSRVVPTERAFELHNDHELVYANLGAFAGPTPDRGGGTGDLGAWPFRENTGAIDDVQRLRIPA